MKEILLRNVRIEQDEKSRNLEHFLTDEIGVDICWVHEAKASQALKWKDYRLSVDYLIDAKCYDSAHKVKYNAKKTKNKGLKTAIFPKNIAKLGLDHKRSKILNLANCF